MAGTSTSGIARSSSDSLSKKRFGRMATTPHSPLRFHDAAVSYSGAATISKGTDSVTGSNYVCGGAVVLLAGVGLGVLTEDTIDAETGRFALDFKGWIEADTGLTVPAGTVIYWDDTAKELTTTSTSNTKVGYVASGITTPYVTVSTTATLGSLPVGTWLHVQLVPFA